MKGQTKKNQLRLRNLPHQGKKEADKAKATVTKPVSKTEISFTTLQKEFNQ